VKRLVVVLVLGNDDLPVLVPLFRHGAPIQARMRRRFRRRSPPRRCKGDANSTSSG
jgi:hypothetical protein